MCIRDSPNTAVLGGGGYQIVGVQVGMRPQNYTDANGVTYRDWEVEFVITKSSSPAFVNGSTLSSVLYNSAIIVSEAAEPNELNSHESALSFMAPPTSCLTHLNNGSPVSYTHLQDGAQRRMSLSEQRAECPYTSTTVDSLTYS